MKLLIKSATIIDPSSPFHNKKQDLLIENGKVSKISKLIENPNKYKEIELENLHISQGWFDTSVCFGEPGFEERETIENGLNTAAKSGFTDVAVNANTYPVADNKSAIEFIKNKGNNSATFLHPIGSLTKNAKSEDLAELFDMQNSGAIAFSDYNKPIANANLLKIALQYVQNFDALVFSFPQDNSIAGDGLVNEQINSTKLGLKGIPSLAEEMQITRDLFLLEYTGGKLHIPTISTAKSVKLIKQAKKNGLNVTCSVAAHHLVLTDDELVSFDANTKVLPPLRTLKDVKALIKGVNDGVIDIITSDHNPIDVEHKKVEYSAAKFGTIGLESLFGALNKVLPLETLITCLTTKPKNRFGIKNISINEGEKANFTLFNPDSKAIFTKDCILSSSKNSVFLNKKMNGKVYGIIANNKVVL
ncbi:MULTISPECIES: dihydroorotase [Flavobacteriaceae]|uniref:Dihydroorotase n=2 Tax=Flavobacteriaceae TaxID=49546 RepID=A0A4Y8AWQ6_9FLAO|nr:MULTISPECIES: dihydroorotase [Flavobacteriaceae]TEW76950.1 dihydroorotase [Gramella jeungdoensis]GGK59084.1 dihydroorotase [Lutibacter litoralis]